MSRKTNRLHPVDRTRYAVRDQLKAMGCTLFDLGLRHQPTGRMLQRCASASLLLQQLSWLKHLNANDHHIYIRPHRQAASHGLVLIDDLCDENLNNLHSDQLAPALVVETSPANYQAWLRFEPPPPDPVRTMLARILATRYHGDMSSAHYDHYGRLAGFTNPKPCHRTPCGAPWTFLRAASGKSVPHPEQLVRHAQQLADQQRLQKQTAAPPANDIRPKQQELADDLYRAQIERIHQQYGAETDWSRADWAGACALARAGCPISTIQDIILRLSPSLTTRKKGHDLDYALRTATKAVRDITSRTTMRQRHLQPPRRRRRPFSPGGRCDPLPPDTPASINIPENKANQNHHRDENKEGDRRHEPH